MLFECGYFLKQINGRDCVAPLLLVYEEAHKYVPKMKDAKYNSSRTAIERIAKEGRKYGITLAIVSQRPSEISETIFSQCSNFLYRIAGKMVTLKREFEEELHAKIEVDNLLAIGEIYFPWGKRPCHQICLYYNVHLIDDNIPLDGVFHGYDELDNERIDLDFCWVSLEDLKKGTKVYPLELIPYILESGKEIVHFVSKQI